MKTFEESNYRKQRNIYFDTKSKHGRKADTIIFWYAITPKGNISSYWNTLRFNSERNVSREYMEQKIKDMKFPKLPKGYIWSKPLLYSGNL